jgi:hypothetical protein
VGRGGSQELVLDGVDRFGLDDGFSYIEESELRRLESFHKELLEISLSGHEVQERSRDLMERPEWQLLPTYRDRLIVQEILDVLTSDRMLAFWNHYLWMIEEYGWGSREGTSALTSDYSPFAVRLEAKIHLRDGFDSATTLCGIKLNHLSYLRRTDYVLRDCCKTCLGAESHEIPTDELRAATEPLESILIREEPSERKRRALAQTIESTRKVARELLLETPEESFNAEISKLSEELLRQAVLSELPKLPSQIRFANLFHHTMATRTMDGRLRSYAKALEALGKMIRKLHPEAPTENRWPTVDELAEDRRWASSQPLEGGWIIAGQLFFATRVAARQWPDALEAFVSQKAASRQTLGEKLVAEAAASMGIMPSR